MGEEAARVSDWPLPFVLRVPGRASRTARGSWGGGSEGPSRRVPGPRARAAWKPLPVPQSGRNFSARGRQLCQQGWSTRGRVWARILHDQIINPPAQRRGGSALATTATALLTRRAKGQGGRPTDGEWRGREGGSGEVEVGGKPRWEEGKGERRREREREGGGGSKVCHG